MSNPYFTGTQKNYEEWPCCRNFPSQIIYQATFRPCTSNLTTIFILSLMVWIADGKLTCTCCDESFSESLLNDLAEQSIVRVLSATLTTWLTSSSCLLAGDDSLTVPITRYNRIGIMESRPAEIDELFHHWNILNNNRSARSHTMIARATKLGSTKDTLWLRVSTWEKTNLENKV